MSKRDEIANLEQQLTELLGKTRYTPTKCRCTGKWSGTTDYSLIFEDQSQIFISNGKLHYEETLRSMIAQYKFYADNKSRLTELTAQIVEHDNRQAIQLGLRPVTFNGLILLDKPKSSQVFWIGARMELGGLAFTHLETSFYYALRGIPLGNEDYFRSLIDRPDERLGGLKHFSREKHITILTGYLYDSIRYPDAA